MSKVLIFISENTSKFKELENCLNNIKKDKSNVNRDVNNLVFLMIKPNGELHEIQSLNRNEIIIHKLKTAREMIKNIINPNSECWIMVEDTSLCIKKENGFPGPFIKYYLQVNSIWDIFQKNWASPADSIVTFGICKFISGSDDHESHVFEGIITGNIVTPAGENGFGFDPIFKPNGSEKTNAEMTMNEKAVYNPRIMAFNKVIDFIC